MSSSKKPVTLTEYWGENKYTDYIRHMVNYHTLNIYCRQAIKYDYRKDISTKVRVTDRGVCLIDITLIIEDD